MPKYNVMIARFPFGNQECPDSTDWIVETVLKMKKDPRVGDIIPRRYDDTPITMTRNRCINEAKQLGVDYVLMIDSDMKPDLPGPGAKPFWDTSWEFALAYGKPCLIAAPYCGPPPVENIYMFQWARKQNDHPNVDMQLVQYSREQAARMMGFEEVGAAPTGLILIDMRVFAHLKPEYFYYEWDDETAASKASTEDVTFTRDCSMSGVRVFCNWDAWAGHWKRKLVTKPTELTIDAIRQNLINTVRENWNSAERIIDVNPMKKPLVVPTVPPAEVCDHTLPPGTHRGSSERPFGTLREMFSQTGGVQTAHNGPGIHGMTPAPPRAPHDDAITEVFKDTEGVVFLDDDEEE